MKVSQDLRDYASRFWKQRRERLEKAGSPVAGSVEAALDGCSPEERPLLEYLAATLPLSDLGDYDPKLFLNFVREALLARAEFPWCAALPEHIFLLDVLYPRINTEELADCRGLFREALTDRVRGLSLGEAILEVNRWCAEHVSYRSTDDRTASPLAVYRCGYGRCGEESTFTVSALRSVGIAARQIYAPLWSHCDDNHAWVEAWDGEGWRYLGACEPEPELDRGWFTSAASRAMMIHARAFVQGDREDFSFLFPDTDLLDLGMEDGVACESVTRRYGQARLVSVSVQGPDGLPLPGARVSFRLLNMARCSETAVRKTGQDGTASLYLGLGSVEICAWRDELWAETVADISKTSRVELSLSEREREPAQQDLDFLAPAGDPGYPAPLSPEKKQDRRRVLDLCAALREKWLRNAPPALKLTEQQARALSVLTEKDRAGGVSVEVLEDAQSGFEWEGAFPRDVFEKALLSQRVGLEPLRPWREELAGRFSQEERERFREDPRQIWLWMERELPRRDPADLSYPDLGCTPAGILRLRSAGERERNILFCALCRAVGVPARLSHLDGSAEFWMAGGFSPACPLMCEEGKIVFTAPDGQAGLDGQNFSVSRWERGSCLPVRTGDIPPGTSRELCTVSGLYRVMTTSRMPGGDQLARRTDFFLPPGEVRRVELTFREGKAADMLECLGLPPFALRDRDGAERDSGSLLKSSPFSLLLWLEPGREPTEHILNELRESAEEIRSTGCAVWCILESPEEETDATLQKTVSRLPEARIAYGDFPDTVTALARRMFTDPEKLPLVLLTDCKGNGLYAHSGYNVGTMELVIRLLRELDKR